MINTMVDQRLVDTATAAAFLGKPRSWLYNNAERYRVPRHKLGNHYRYRLSEINEWLRGQALGAPMGAR